MSAPIKVFRVGDKWFKHVMRSDLDRIELRDEEDNTLLTYSADAKVYDKNGRLGHMSLQYLDGQPRWTFCETALQACIPLAVDLPSAAVEVSKRYLGALGLVGGGCVQG